MTHCNSQCLRWQSWRSGSRNDTHNLLYINLSSDTYHPLSNILHQVSWFNCNLFAWLVDWWSFGMFLPSVIVNSLKISHHWHVLLWQWRLSLVTLLDKIHSQPISTCGERKGIRYNQGCPLALSLFYSDCIVMLPCPHTMKFLLQMLTPRIILARF